MIESIYNLIEKPKQDVIKKSMYRSKFDPKAPITGSTLGLHGTNVTVGKGVHELKRTCIVSSTFGPSPEKPDPAKFLRKGSRLESKSSINKRFKREKADPKPPVPSCDEKPIMGLYSNKNFIVANAVEVINMEPKKVLQTEASYLEKEDYGKVPKYLYKVKEDIEKEKEIIRQFVKENAIKDGSLREQPEYDILDENERRELIDGLKAKWDLVNSKYQKVCHRVMIDSIGELRRKQTQEAELQQLEDDIEKLSRPGPIYLPISFGINTKKTLQVSLFTESQMTFERESLEKAFQTWHRYITWGIYRANGICDIGEVILLRKWFNIWKHGHMNNIKCTYLVRKLVVEQLVLRKWKSLCTARDELQLKKRIYLKEWSIRSKAKIHITNAMNRILAQRKLIQLRYCVRQWEEAYNFSIFNAHQTEHLIREFLQVSRHLVLSLFLRDAPFILVVRYWRKWRGHDIHIPPVPSINTKPISIDTCSNSSAFSEVQIQAPCSIMEEMLELSYEKEDPQVSSSKHHVKNESKTKCHTRQDAEFNFRFILQRKKAQFSQQVESLNDMTKLLKKAEYDVQVNERAIKTCSEEINHHCCICGGIHVFYDHEPTKYATCKRLKSKARSFIYLKQAKVEAIGRVRDWEVCVKQCKKEIEDSRMALKTVLHRSLFQDECAE